MAPGTSPQNQARGWAAFSLDLGSTHLNEEDPLVWWLSFYPSHALLPVLGSVSSEPLTKDRDLEGIQPVLSWD